jgi:Astacin (Peptidase family M12A)
MHIKRKLNLFVGILFSILLINCGGDDNKTSTSKKAISDNQSNIVNMQTQNAPPIATKSSNNNVAQGLVTTNVIWPNPTINVCWVNPEAHNETERKWVRDSIDRTWVRHSALYFVGWGKCPATNQKNAIRIKINDENPRSFLGTDTLLQDESMWLNFEFNHPDFISCKNSSTMRRSCIESIAVHEFGHAVGFEHEQNRIDTPKSCSDKYAAEFIPSTNRGNQIIGNWDENSVMNYCNKNYSGFGKLSPIDIDMVQKYYKPNLVGDFSFDSNFYLGLYPDLRAAFGNNHNAAYQHWLNHGIKEGRRASIAFDVKFYLSKYADLKQAFGNDYAQALNHWRVHGINEGRQGSRELNSTFYLDKHVDLQQAYGGNNYIAALSHWYFYGFNEKRQTSAEFNINRYLEKYPDLQEAFKYTNSFDSFDYDSHKTHLHWLMHGINEGRTAI